MPVISEPFAIDYDTVGHVVHFTDGMNILYSLFFNGTHNENLHYVFSKGKLVVVCLPVNFMYFTYDFLLGQGRKVESKYTLK